MRNMMKRLALPVLASFVVALALPAVATAQAQQEEPPAMIDGKKVHKVKATVVDWERPVLVVEVQPEGETEDERDNNLSIMLHNQMDEEYQDYLLPGTEVHVWYTVDEDSNVAVKVEKTTDREHSF